MPNAGSTPPPPPPPPPDAGAIADAYGLGNPIGPPVFAARGELGRIWRLDTSAGTWAIKELLEPPTEAEAADDVAFQEAAIRVGVPMPRPVLTRDGTVLARSAAVDRGLIIRAYTWVDLAGREAVADLAGAGQILGRLHALAYPDPRTSDPWFTAPVDEERWDALVAATEAQGAAWAPDLRGLAAAFAEARPLVLSGRHEPTIRCHLDFNPDNVLVDVNGGLVVVDWENGGAASAEQELAMTVDVFVDEPAMVSRFLAGYREGGGTAELRDRSSFAMAYAMLGNLVAHYAERALDDAVGEEDRARAAYWIGDIAAHGVSLARTDALLLAAR